MKVETFPIMGPVVIIPDILSDSRGYFSETYHKLHSEKLGISSYFVQDNQSMSLERGVIRGLHFQIEPHAQDKLVRVLKGSIFDVAVDLRRGSPTFGEHISVILSGKNFKQLWIPKGFAHGFCTLDAETEVFYKVSDFYSKECERGLAWNDPQLNIDWPVDHSSVILSEKDKLHPFLADLPDYF